MSCEAGGGMNWEIGIDIYTLICIKCITNKNLLYNEVNQLYVYICPLPLGPPSHPAPNPTHLGHHRAPS